MHECSLSSNSRSCNAVVVFLCLIILFPTQWISAARAPEIPDSESVITSREPVIASSEPLSELTPLPTDSITAESDSALIVVSAPGYSPEYGLKRPFNPDPTKAVWLSALFPGLGQIYNRRYWKLPIIVGGFMGLGYATSWNNTQLSDYTRAYRDLLDDDPDTKSYMDFFPPTTTEDSLDKTWLKSTLKSRKDYYRRNRDLCIICMVGLYLLCMVDAYVDASLSHFDISPDLSLDIQPAMQVNPSNRKLMVGLNWAFTF